jgi:cell division protein FtsI/penicillin-binding protein 2
VPRDKIAALIIVIVGVVVIGAGVGGFNSEQSPEPVARSFLLDWQQQDYADAGALTTAPAGQVAGALGAAFRQLDATALFLTMNSVVQHGSTAVAKFTAQVNLAGDGGPWKYDGSFGLVKIGGDWQVSWTPEVIAPGLHAGDRLAVLTTYPSRGQVLDSAGQPLQAQAPVYVAGVVPGQLDSAAATAKAFAHATGVEATQVSGELAAAPPRQFFKLAMLDPDTYQRLRSGLHRVPGLVIREAERALYQTVASELVGAVGSEVDPALRAAGAYYLPGGTIGLGGLEQAFQRQLLGTPTTSIVAINAAGDVDSVLDTAPGTPGVPLRTTISSPVQNAAIAALSTVPESGEIVAVQASTGKVLAVAQHTGSVPLPPGGVLNARLSPGTAFTIVSAAALLQSGLAVNTPISCTNSFTVGGQTFTSDGTGSQKPFSADFARGCGTAFAGLSYRLQPQPFAALLHGFGLGVPWSLPVPAYSGSVPLARGQADLAAETIGSGNVQVSPLGMALVAAEVDSGSWHPPVVLAAGSPAADPPAGVAAPLDPGALDALRGLMWGAVHSGAASAARVPGPSVFGQIGLTRSGSQWLSWFVGYRGDVAFTIIEAGSSPRLSAAALAHAFVSALP